MVVYVLLLENSKYYIGYSEEYIFRLKKHFKNQGSLWTKKYPPIGVLEIIQGDKKIEKKTTLKYMRKYGWENVRGGA